jgi:predicted alpha-1,2-mannosidase
VHEFFFLSFLWLALLPGKTMGIQASDSASNPADEVNMFFATNSSAQCPLTAARPFGMVSPGPINNPGSPSGFKSGLDYILGFNHTHLQGTGRPGYGVITILPTNGDHSFRARSSYSQDKVKACPGYVKMELETFGITAEMTATLRTAFHKYTFPESGSSRILIDCSLATIRLEKPTYGDVEQENSRELSGYATSTVWATNTTWFYMEFSKPVVFTDDSIHGGYVSFNTADREEVLVKVGISYVSSEQAKKNMNAEIPGWNFEAVRESAYEEWNSELSKIEITGGSRDQRAIFYSALYRSLFHPQLTSDVDGSYRGMDEKVHRATDHGHYSVLSTWDTFRAEHPLINMLRPDVALDVVKTMLDDYQQSGWTPKWKLAYKENSCMPGAWACLIIPESYAMGINAFDTELAWEALYHDAHHSNGPSGYENVDQYLSLGWIDGNVEKVWNGTTRTLQNAYCDFGLHTFAEALGKSAKAEYFRKRAYYCNNLWDKETQFFRGRHPDGSWVHEAFDPTFSHVNGHHDYGDYTEGNAWQYLFHQMQDLQDMISKLGGDAAFEAKLDLCFSTRTGGKNEDIGQYWHGNEPDQHYLYLYNYIGKPWKSAEKIRYILDTCYANNGWGISGNDDAGQMSAWYVLSSLGFYPVTNGIGEFVIGSPIFESAVLHLPGGDFNIIARNNSVKNMYIQEARLNGAGWNNTYLPFSSIKGGGTLDLKMGSTTGSSWGTAADSRPYSLSNKMNMNKP